MANKKQIKEVKFLIAQRKYLNRFKQLLLDLQNFSVNRYFKQTIQRFRSCIQSEDVTSLPFFSLDSFSSKADKDQCVLCVLSVTVQEYWKFRDLGIDPDSTIHGNLTTLENYAKDGRKAYEVAGRFPKFYLKKI